MTHSQQNQISSIELKNGFDTLSTLAKEEYRDSLLNVATDAKDPIDRRIMRVGRVMGVLMKRPFSDPNPLAKPVPETGAYRHWSWIDKRYMDPSSKNLWQHQLIEHLHQDYKFDPSRMAERGFFSVLANSVRKYICGDPTMAQQLETAVAELQRQGSSTGGLTPQVLLGSSGTGLATLLVQQVPWLVPFAPIIAGLVVIIGTVGLDAFCTWTKTYHHTLE